MYDPYIVKRTQIYLEESQATRLARRANAAGVTTSRLIREAISEYLADDEGSASEVERQRRALDEAFGSIPRLPEGKVYVESIRADEAERERELEERWRSR